MNYLKMIKQKEAKRLALIHDGIPYTYGELVEKAVKLSRDDTVFPENFKKEADKKQIHIIQRKEILDQLLEFLSCSERKLIPMIVPKEITISLKQLENIKIPENACMAVMTSGTCGEPKILFRTYESWADFFPVQNEIFGIKETSRLFVQGSLAFTGNLNLYLAQFFAGAVIIAENTFSPKKWLDRIEQKQADSIYLIPSKLFCLLQVLEKKGEKNKNNIKMIVTGSQGFSGEDAKRLKQYFSQAELLYYYGASELNYLTYIKDKDMTWEKNLVGKPFPGVTVFVKNGEIFIDTLYHAEGISCPCTISDKGYLDRNGNLYFCGRSDDILEIHGCKISAVFIENALEQIEGIEEAVVMVLIEKEQQVLTAFVSLKEEMLREFLYWQSKKPTDQYKMIDMITQGYFLGEVKRNQVFQKLKNKLKSYEIPDKLIVVREMPRNDSGKIEKKKLKQEWNRQFSSCWD